MFSVLAAALRLGKMTSQDLPAAVARGWITQAEADEIVAAEGNVGVLL